MTAVAYDYKDLKVVAYHGRVPLTGFKTVHGHWTKYGDAAPGQNLDSDLFRQFPLISKGFWRETTSIGFFIKLALHPYMDCQKRSMDVSVWPVLW